MDVISKILFLLTSEERRSALVILGLMIVGMVLETLGVGLIIPAISILTQEDFIERYPEVQTMLGSFGSLTRIELVVGGMVLLILIYLVKALFLAYLVWQQSRFAFDVQAQLSAKLFTNYLRQPYTFHLQRNSAQLIRNVTSEVNMFTNSALLSTMSLVTEGLVLLGIATLLLIVEPLGAVIVVMVVGFAAWVFQHNTRSHIARWGQNRQFHEGLRIQHLQQGLGGVKDVKLLGREEEFLSHYRLHNKESARMGQYQATLLNLPRLWLELLAVSGMAILVLSMIAQGIEVENIVPTLGLFAIAAFRLMPSISRILTAIQSIRYGIPVLDTLYEELSLAAPEPSSQTPLSVVSFQDEIRIADVSFTYPGTMVPALNNLTMSVKKGDSLGIVGSSGAGKSTLVDIVLGLLVPDSGEVLVDGLDIHQNLRNWQNQIGYVPQTIYLTDDTIRRNVALGVPDELIDENSVLRAIRESQLDDFVSSLSEGVATLVGERGMRLSGGQRQRIGIARALYHDPSVLVLDEATSALDTDTESSVMQAISALQNEKTMIIVAHRLSTLTNCTQVVEVGSLQSVKALQ